MIHKRRWSMRHVRMVMPFSLLHLYWGCEQTLVHAEVLGTSVSNGWL